MKKNLKILAIALIFEIFITYTNISVASNKTDLQNQKTDLTDSISDAKEDLKNIEKEKSETQSQVEDLTEKISGYQTEIDELEVQISGLEKNIKDAEKQIKEDEEEYKKQQQALNERLVTIYENGDISYLDVLLSSSSLTDFISSYYIVSELTNYDSEMLKQVEEEKQKIENEKKELEDNKKSLDTAKETIQSKSKSLQVAKNEKQKEVNKLSEDEKQTQKDIDEMLEDKAKIDKELQKIAAEEARKAAEAARKAAEEAAAASKNNNSSSSSTNNSSSTHPTAPSSAGYIFPVAGCSKANINNLKYPSYAGHTGIDVNINVVGKSVVAVKNGKVIKSEALKNSNGTYRSYGEYVMISHADGTVTVYAHMLAGSRKVKEGDTVKQGQPIGTVGSTGNSSGTHLHFEVRVLTNIGSGYVYKVVNPITYLP